MPRFIDQHFENCTLVLDGNEYRRCTFRNCTFLYGGSLHAAIDHGKMDGCTISLYGAAANTLAFLAMLTKTDLRDSVKKVMLAGELAKFFIERS
jgi:hypothetical protein